MCGAIDNTGVKYSVGGMSLRQNSNYSYLERFFDTNSKLEWYKDETPLPEEETNENTPDETPESYDESMVSSPMTEYIDEIPEFEMPKEKPELIPEALPTPTPIPEELQEESITDRLNRLLDIFAHNIMKGNYKFVFLTNGSETGDETDLSTGGNTTSNEVMKLNITIEFIMYTNPKDSKSSIMVKKTEV